MNPIMRNQYNLVSEMMTPLMIELKKEQRQDEIDRREQEWINSTRFDD